MEVGWRGCEERKFVEGKGRMNIRLQKRQNEIKNKTRQDKTKPDQTRQREGKECHVVESNPLTLTLTIPHPSPNQKTVGLGLGLGWVMDETRLKILFSSFSSHVWFDGL
jgi:hypothetical protein